MQCVSAAATSTGVEGADTAEAVHCCAPCERHESLQVREHLHLPGMSPLLGMRTEAAARHKATLAADRNALPGAEVQCRKPVPSALSIISLRRGHQHQSYVTLVLVEALHRHAQLISESKTAACCYRGVSCMQLPCAELLCRSAVMGITASPSRRAGHGLLYMLYTRRLPHTTAPGMSSRRPTPGQRVMHAPSDRRAKQPCSCACRTVMRVGHDSVQQTAQ